MNEPQLLLARSFAEILARQAGKITLSYTQPGIVERKSDDSQVTEADRRIQGHIVAAIAENYPGHAFIGEEDMAHDARISSVEQAEFCWVVDPLDGTRNFTRSLPITATSIALMQQNRPVVAVVYEHLSGWCCSAVAGGGAVCGNRPMRVCGRPVDRDTLIAVPSGRRQPILPLIQAWTDKYVLRNVGSTALHMAYVATGAVDAAVCLECKLWDVAAGWLLITEAGGQCRDLRGREFVLPHPADYHGEDLPFFAASPAVFDELLTDLGAGPLA